MCRVRIAVVIGVYEDHFLDFVKGLRAQGRSAFGGLWYPRAIPRPTQAGSLHL